MLMTFDAPDSNVCCPPGAVQHAAAGPDPAQRHGLRRGAENLAAPDRGGTVRLVGRSAADGFRLCVPVGQAPGSDPLTAPACRSCSSLPRPTGGGGPKLLGKVRSKESLATEAAAWVAFAPGAAEPGRIRDARVRTPPGPLCCGADIPVCLVRWQTGMSAPHGGWGEGFNLQT